MSEITFVYCDFCNKGQDRLRARGVICDCNKKRAISDFGWIEGKFGIMCVECQDEAVADDEGKDGGK